MSRSSNLRPLRERLSPSRIVARAEKILRRREEKEAARLLAKASSRRSKKGA